MTKLKISIYELRDLSFAIDMAYQYLTDNSCSDPDCCGNVGFSASDYQDALDTLARLGLELEIDHTIRD